MLGKRISPEVKLEEQGQYTIYGLLETFNKRKYLMEQQERE
jgi:hypothetical protein